MIGLLSIAIFLPAGLAAPTYLLGRKNAKVAKILGLGATTIVFAISIMILVVFQYGQAGFQLSESAPWAGSFGLNYKVGIDGISLPLLMIATFLSLLSAAGSWDQITFRHAEYYALFLIFTYSGSAVMLFGFLALYAWTGTSAYPGGPSFDYDVLVARIPNLALPLQLAVAITTFVGFAVKLPIFPLHTWLPDAHVEAPAPVSVLLAGLLLKMGGYGLIRYNLLLFPKAVNVLWPYFTTIGLITMIYGASVALVAKDIKRMIALTSVNHMGYVLLGAFTATVVGVSGAVFQMFSHGLAVGMLFLMSGYIHDHTGTRNIDELKGLRGKMPQTVTLLFLASMAAMAVPGFANFISEYLVIQGALSVSYLFAIAIVAPALTVGYFLWMLRRVAMTPGVGPKTEMRLHSILILVAFLVPLLIFGVYPPPILGSVITPTVEKWVGTIVALGAR